MVFPASVAEDPNNTSQIFLQILRSGVISLSLNLKALGQKTRARCEVPSWERGKREGREKKGDKTQKS